MKDVIKRSLTEHRAALERGEYSSLELTQLCLKEMESREGDVGAFLTQTAETAIVAAKESDARRAKGCARGALDGIPYALKDNFCTAGIPTTCASKMLEGFVPPYDASVVERLRESGAILLGKLNMDEFAMGSTGESSALGRTRNPVDLAYVTGGSSSGSAAAVAAFEVPFAIGSDTGGSVRQPAAFCGVYGMKPTYGVISRYGMIALASSLDCVGLVTRSAEDCGALLSCLARRDCRDATSVAHQKPNFAIKTGGAGRPLRVAVVRELMEEGVLSDEVRSAVLSAQEVLREMGAEIEEVSLPSPEAALAAYGVICSAEAASNLARYDGIRYGYTTKSATDLSELYAQSRSQAFGYEVKKRILFGTYMMGKEQRAVYYDRAQQARVQIRERMLRIFRQYDLILSPTAPTAAFRAGRSVSSAEQRRADLCVVYASLAGLPALSVPFGKGRDGLPLAIQLIAAPFEEGLLLETAEGLGEVER